MTGSLCPVQPDGKSSAGKHTIPLKIHRRWAKHCRKRNSKSRFSEKCPLFVSIYLPLREPVYLKPFFIFVFFLLCLLASSPSLLFSYRSDNSKAFVSGGKLRWRILIWGFLLVDINSCFLLASLQRYMSHSLLSDHSAPQRAVRTRG